MNFRKLICVIFGITLSTCEIIFKPSLWNVEAVILFPVSAEIRSFISDAEAFVFDMSYNWKTDLGYYIASTGKFTPADADIKVPDGYVDRIKKTVRNKINYCSKVLETDYFSYFLGK